MNSLIKDIAVLLFRLGDEIEGKTKEYKEKREERFRQFSEKIKDRQDQFSSKHEEAIKKAQEGFSKVVSKAGLATKSELDDLKKVISEFDTKLDKILEQK